MKVSKKIINLETESAFTVLAKANKLLSEGKDIINLGIGQPDFPTPINIQEAAINESEDLPLTQDVLTNKSRERDDRLKNISMKLRTPSGLTSLEDEPAYKRDNVELEETPHSSESEVSKYTLSEGEDNKTEIKPNNSFLHDNVD